MTTPNTPSEDELRTEIAQIASYFKIQHTSEFEAQVLGVFKRHTNKQILDVLDRLESEAEEINSLYYQESREATDVKAVLVSQLKSERSKLDE